MGFNFIGSRLAAVAWSVVATSLLACSVCQAEPPGAKSATVAVQPADFYVAVNGSDTRRKGRVGDSTFLSVAAHLLHSLSDHGVLARIGSHAH